MRQNIIGSMLACQDTMDRRPNTFELYGADFIIDELHRPWLLEINSSPDLSCSTSVTARMCPQLLEDLVKGSYQNFQLDRGTYHSFVFSYSGQTKRYKH